MQNINLKYGLGMLEIQLPADQLFVELAAKHMDPLSSPKDAILSSLDNPMGAPPLNEIVIRGEKVAIIVSDITRATKADVFLPILVDYLNQAGVPDQDIFIVFSNGTHPLHTKDKQEKIVGKEIAARINMLDHDCWDTSNLIYLGQTSRGTPVWVNKKVWEADRIILTGSITYHYFAGFGGGRKAVLPGIAAFETIEKNHQLSMLPACTTAALDNNPLSLDMEEAAQMLSPDFIFNTVLNENKELCGVFAGDLIAAHRAGCRFINDSAMVQIPEKADLVIAAAGGGGMDLNFVQSHKAMENAHFALKDGGVMILLADSREGFPSNVYEQYIKLGSAERVHQELKNKFSIPGHTVYAAFCKAEKYRIIWVSKLPAPIVRNMKITPAQNFSEAYALARKWLGGAFKAYLLPVAYTTFPVVVS